MTNVYNQIVNKKCNKEINVTKGNWKIKIKSSYILSLICKSLFEKKYICIQTIFIIKLNIYKYLKYLVRYIPISNEQNKNSITQKITH